MSKTNKFQNNSNSNFVATLLSEKFHFKIEDESGKNNFVLNMLEFLFLTITFGLSLYNLGSPSDIISTENIAKSLPFFLTVVLIVLSNLVKNFKKFKNCEKGNLLVFYHNVIIVYSLFLGLIALALLLLGITKSDNLYPVIKLIYLAITLVNFVVEAIIILADLFKAKPQKFIPAPEDEVIAINIH